jgi:Flp pilus assembly protein TadD
MNRIKLAVVAALLLGACAGSSNAQRPDTFAARKQLTRELVARHDWPEAFFYANQLRSERPNDVDALVLRGTVYREQGLTEEAEADLREALRLNEAVADAHAGLALLFDETGRSEEAEAHHARAIALAPEPDQSPDSHQSGLCLGGEGGLAAGGTGIRQGRHHPRARQEQPGLRLRTPR